MHCIVAIVSLALIYSGSASCSAHDGVMSPELLQNAFQTSNVIRTTIPLESDKSGQINRISAYTERGVNRWIFTNTTELSTFLNRIYVVLIRAFHIKYRERDVFARSLGASIIMSLLVGLMLQGQGDFGDRIYTEFCLVFTLGTVYYTAPMYASKFPIVIDQGCNIAGAKVMNISGGMFLSISITLAQQVLNVHLLVRKLMVRICGSPV
jgi:hypothetical protein